MTGRLGPNPISPTNSLPPGFSPGGFFLRPRQDGKDPADFEAGCVFGERVASWLQGVERVGCIHIASWRGGGRGPLGGDFLHLPARRLHLLAFSSSYQHVTDRMLITTVCLQLDSVPDSNIMYIIESCPGLSSMRPRGRPLYLAVSVKV